MYSTFTRIRGRICSTTAVSDRLLNLLTIAIFLTKVQWTTISSEFVYYLSLPSLCFKRLMIFHDSPQNFVKYPGAKLTLGLYSYLLSSTLILYLIKMCFSLSFAISP